MKIYDVITFFNELDLLELRFEILDKYVDYFVVSEAPFTFTGIEKPLHFLENKDRFKKFKDKIIYHTFTENKSEWGCIERELAQKGSAIEDLVKEFNEDDIIIHSDADEIPNLEKIDFGDVIDLNKLFIFKQYCFYYYLNTITVSNGNIFQWDSSRLAPWKLFRRSSINDFRGFDTVFVNRCPCEVVHVNNGGWHFSYLGNAENIKRKIQAYSHTEFNSPFVLDNIERNVKELKDPFFRQGAEIRIIPMTINTHPQYLIENQQKYSHLIREK